MFRGGGPLWKRGHRRGGSLDLLVLKNCSLQGLRMAILHIPCLNSSLTKFFFMVPCQFKDIWVALIPKVASVSFSRQFRPISLLEPMQKLYAGLLTNRLQSTWPRIVNQLGGAPGKQVLDALFCTTAFVTRETVEDAHSVWVCVDIRAAFGLHSVQASC